MSVNYQESYNKVIGILFEDIPSKNYAVSINDKINRMKEIFKTVPLSGIHQFLKTKTINNKPYDSESNPYKIPLSIAILENLDIVLRK